MPMLEVHDVHAYYGNIHALKGISLHVEQGEIVTLIGANGAGKSSTLRAITGLLPPRQGQVKPRRDPSHWLKDPGAFLMVLVCGTKSVRTPRPSALYTFQIVGISVLPGSKRRITASTRWDLSAMLASSAPRLRTRSRRPPESPCSGRQLLISWKSPSTALRSTALALMARCP